MAGSVIPTSKQPERPFTIFVEYASHDDLKDHVIARGVRRVVVLAVWLDEAKLLACQIVMSTHLGDMATRAETEHERNRRVQAEAGD